MSLGTVPALSFGLYSKFFQAIWIIPRVRNQQKPNRLLELGRYFAPQITWDLAENIPPLPVQRVVERPEANPEILEVNSSNFASTVMSHDDNPLGFFWA